MKEWSWRSPWGTIPVLVVNGRIAAIALDARTPPEVPDASTGRTPAPGPIASSAVMNATLNAAIAGRLSSRTLLAAVDLQWATPFERSVLRALATIPAGATATYGELAAAIGAPRAARAVGSALGRNRVPVLLPCHRVLAAAGIGGYGSGAGSTWRPGGMAPLAFKRALLAREGVDLR
ncbi:MAG: methylated-DNA--protein-cysteine methyltransferase [Chloroflexota bacterium]|jgi:O-6-methylguanine DNA methyltransferase